MTRNEVYLGRSTDGMLIFASVSVDHEDKDEVTFVDHTTGPRPAEVGIMFTSIQDVPTARGRALNLISDRWWESSGQIPAAERVIPDASAAVRVVERMWETSHLNNMNAACSHMTQEMLNPADAVLDTYIAEHEAADKLSTYRPTFYGRTDALQKWRLDNVVCPVTGYRYGHAWLARKIDEADIINLLTAVATLPKGAR